VGTGKVVTGVGFGLTGSSSGNYSLAATTLTTSANITKLGLTVTAANKAMLLNGVVPALTYTPTGFVGGDTAAVVSGTAVCATANGTAIGSFDITCTIGSLTATNYAFTTFVKGTLTVSLAATGNCLGSPGHAILQPVDADGSSVFKQGSTVPAKFRVCDANGVSIGAAGTVTSFRLVKTVNGTVSAVVDEDVVSTTPDTAFRWSASDQQWIFNMNTKAQKANQTYYYEITLNDTTKISFNFGLK
jgi:hypothetical protein